jgi:citrate synthase
LEDSLNLIAKLPAIAATIYRKAFHGGDYIEPDASLDWAANLAHMMGMRPRGRAGTRPEAPAEQRYLRVCLTVA